jgi:hypothetical protein
MKYCLFIILFIFYPNAFGQTKFKIKEVETKNWKSIYYIVNEKGETVKELDTSKYSK